MMATQTQQGTTEETRTGKVLRVVFENNDSGFRVIRVQLPTHALEAWVGIMPTMRVGADVEAVGVPERRNGEDQFRVRSVIPKMPTTGEGIAEYLGSGAFPGIGVELGRRIVAHFGDKTTAVLEENPERVIDVQGIGRKTAEKFAKAWVEQRALSAVMVCLMRYGVSPALAKRIHDKYKARAVEIVETQPYKLAVDIRGVGFLTADAIAQATGIPKDSPERARAAIVHILREMNGHVYMRRDKLVEAAEKLLGGVAPARIEQAIDALDEARGIMVEEIGPFQAVYDMDAHIVERMVVGRLLALATTKPRDRKPLDPEAAIAAYEKAAKIELAPEQREAVRLAASSKVLVLTGGPGTGKSSVCKALVSMFDAGGFHLRLVSPTGRAAKRLRETTGKDAATIHRTLGRHPSGKGFLYDETNALPMCDVMICDESSMADQELAAGLLGALPAHARLILVGDVDQLPSVGPGAVLRDIIASEAIPTVRLSRIFRQAAGSTISENAQRIIRGEMPASDAGERGEFYIIDRREPEDAAAMVVKLATERITKSFNLDPRRDIQVITPMHKGPAGTVALNAALQERINPARPGLDERKRGEIVYRVGDKVMQLKNDVERDVYNGDVGYVAAIGPNSDMALVVEIDGREVEYTETQLGELQLAYASTVHRCQGAEAPCVVVVMLKAHHVMLGRNLLYTGVTRGKRLVVLVADPVAVRTAVSEARREDRRTMLAERLRAGAHGR